MFTIRASLAALALTGAALSAQAADALTVAQVEKITGLTGLKVEPSKYDKGGISFMAGKDLVVAVKQESADAYAVWKEQGARGDQQPLAGVGEDAITSKKARYVCFRKSGRGICLTAMPPKMSPIDDDKLLALAKAAAANL